MMPRDQCGIGQLSRNQAIFAALYAASLQWSHVLRLFGLTSNGRFDVCVFIALWGAAAIYAFASYLTWRSFLAIFATIFIVDLGVSVATYLADTASHSRDMPLVIRPIFSFIFAAITSSCLLLPLAKGLLRRN